jgi:hypothetical protein
MHYSFLFIIVSVISKFTTPKTNKSTSSSSTNAFVKDSGASEIVPDIDDITSTTVCPDNPNWEQLNSYLEVKYGTGKNLKRKVVQSDYDIVLKCIEEKEDEDTKYLCSIWLEKMDEKKETTIQKQFCNVPSDRVLRSRSPAGKPSQSNTDTIIIREELNALPSLSVDIDIPTLLKDDTTYAQLKVGYNELDNFFRNADEDIINENLYDMLCLHASNCLYVESEK